MNDETQIQVKFFLSLSLALLVNLLAVPLALSAEHLPDDQDNGPGGRADGEQARTGPFILEASSDGPLYLSDSMPLILELTCYGRKPMETYDFRAPGYTPVQIEAPKSWIRSDPKQYEFVGAPPRRVLIEGVRIKRKIDLRDYFSKMTPGRHEITITATVSEYDVDRPVRYRVRDRIFVNIKEGSKDDASGRLDGLFNQYQEGNQEQKIDILRTSMRDRPQELVLLLLRGLADQDMRLLHPGLRRTLCDVATGEGNEHNQDMLVRWLAKYGGREDEVFFEHWRKQRVLLSSNEFAVMAKANNPWIKLYYLESVPNLDAFQPTARQLEDEAALLSKRVDALEHNRDE